MYFLSRVIRAPSGCCAVYPVRTCKYECRKILPMDETPGPAVRCAKRQRYSRQARHGEQVPQNRGRSISQRLQSTNDEPRKRQIVARRRNVDGFACGSRAATKWRGKSGVSGTAKSVPVRIFFGFCFHGLGQILNAGQFRLDFCGEACAGRNWKLRPGARPTGLERRGRP